MLLSKQFLNEQVQKNNLKENLTFSQRKELDAYDVFISYSYHDRSFADKIVQLLEKCGYTVYIDFRDNMLDRTNVTEETAKRIIGKMKKCKGLLFLYSRSAAVSKWCPWEVGVFSGIKDFRCVNLPLVENKDEKYRHQEYLEVYPYLEYAPYESNGMNEFWVCKNDATYTPLKRWLNGIKL